MRQFICLLFFSIIMKERKKRSVKISLTAFCIFILSIFTHKKRTSNDFEVLFTGFRRPSTLPGSFPPSTIDRSGLNRRVRNGNGCVPWAHHHRKYVIIEDLHLQNRIQSNFHHKIFIRSSPRSISIGQLNTLPCLHLQPIYLIIFKGSYFRRMGNLILRAASRLDAFSVYPFHT